MSPNATLRIRRITAAIAVCWALCAFTLSVVGQTFTPRVADWPMDISGIGGIAVVTAASKPAREAGVENGDHLIEFDGEPVMRSLHRSQILLQPGVANRYTIKKRDNTIVEIDLMPAPPGQDRLIPFLLELAIFCVGLIYLGIGIIVWRFKPDRAESWALLLFTSVMAAELFTVFKVNMIPWAYLRMAINGPLIGATSFHLFTTYPIEPGWVVRHRRVQLVPYAIALLLVCLFFLEDVLRIPAGWFEAITFLFSIGCFALGLGILGRERFRSPSGPRRDRADVMLLGAIVSFIPVTAVMVAQYFLRTDTPYYYAMLLLFLFPAAVGYGILRKQLFDIRMLAKSSVAYGVATLAITGLFALMISLSGLIGSKASINTRSPLLQMVFIFFATLFVFNPLRIRMQQVVDRVFDRDHSNYRKAVREISEAMVSMLSLKEIADRILVALTDTMGVSRAMVMLLDERERVLRPTAWRGEWDVDDMDADIPATHPIWKHLWMRREELARIDFDDDPNPETRDLCRDIFDNFEIELLVPILFGVDLLGIIAVGPKESGDRLSADDRQLLRTLANQSSIAIENAKAYDEIGKLNETLEARVDERTRELRDTQSQLVQSEKMKSLGQLVAGVAHELNNPIGFVHANLQLMDEYIGRLVNAEPGSEAALKSHQAIEKLLHRSREGTQRVTKIVQDLRTFSRTDQAEIQEANLNEEIKRTLALMEVRLKDGVEVECNFGELPLVRCYPGQLNQVFLNLLMNACDALDQNGKIIVNTRAVDSGVELVFEDNGPGIPLEIQSQIFDPFFTTKPVGKGTGLGLSLSHEIVGRHGGQISVETPESGGTRFRIELPLEAPIGDSEELSEA